MTYTGGTHKERTVKIVHVSFTLKPDKLDEYRRLFDEFRPHFESIEGLTLLGPSVSLDNPHTVSTAVVYETEGAYAAAYGSESFKAYGARLVPLIEHWGVYMMYEVSEATALTPLTERLAVAAEAAA
jgi:quinol monooxygenase YgiN